MRYCEYCGEEEPDSVVACNCQAGNLPDYLGRLVGHFYFRTKMGFWHEAAFTDLIAFPLLIFFCFWLLWVWIY